MKTFVNAVDANGVLGMIHFVKPGRWAVESQDTGLGLFFEKNMNSARKLLSGLCPAAKQKTVKTMAKIGQGRSRRRAA